jgi:hypothetical protein
MQKFNHNIVFLEKKMPIFSLKIGAADSDADAICTRLPDGLFSNQKSQIW